MNNDVIQCKKCGRYIFASDECYWCKEDLKMACKVLLRDKTTGKEFEKVFNTEFERDKFLRKLRYSKKLILVNSYDNNLLD